MRVTVVCLAVSAAIVVQGEQVSRVTRPEEAWLARVLDSAAAQQRTGERWLHWTGHFLKGASGQTYVPYTVRIDVGDNTFREVAVGIRVVGFRSGWRDAFAVDTQPSGDGRAFRGAFSVRPGAHRVLIALQDRNARGRSSHPVVLDQRIDVPDFGGRRLQMSSIIVAERVETTPLGLATPRERAAYPYAFGSTNIIPAPYAEFTGQDNLTVTFQIYNAATFEDGRPDVEVRYLVYRDDDARPVGSTAPQVFNQETVPEEFSLKEGYQLTPTQSLPLAQFEPGKYRLRVEVEDVLGNARAHAEVPFTIYARK